MTEEMYYQLAEIEDKHWWFVARRSLLRVMLEKYKITHFGNALDIGCGTGGNMAFLANFCDKITGIDLSPIAVKLGREKRSSYSFIQGDANNLGSFFGDQTFDLVTIFNVLYHKWVNDEAMLQKIHSVLKPRGYLLITEPAFMHLWREHDVIDMGKKRYTENEMKLLLTNQGFKIIASTYFNLISYMPALFLALLYKLKFKPSPVDQNKGVSEINLPGSLINGFMCGAMQIESNLIKKINHLPLGVSVLCIAQKV
jgi:ubiquinone/menaquinone biosynthesis C-methylase UbiE